VEVQSLQRHEGSRRSSKFPQNFLVFLSHLGFEKFSNYERRKIDENDAKKLQIIEQRDKELTRMK
jgi:hypothetical protein